MRWTKSRRSGNVIDVRGSRLRKGAAIGCLPLLLGLLAVLFGADPRDVMNLLRNSGSSAPPAQTQQAPTRPADELGDFTAAVLGSTEDVWNGVYANYAEPELVLFDGVVRSACGTASAATGPFYCPRDQRLYLDTSFFNELARLGARGDLAAAYVIAHEVGHHVQNLEGTLQEVQNLRPRLSETDANALQVRVELQADCYAGVWAGRAEMQDNLLEEGDFEEGMSAAAAVGDDHLMRQSGRAVMPEAFTHGSSAQRQRWFRRGFERRDPAACDTFQ